MKFGNATNPNHVPTWFDKDRHCPIMFVFNGTVNPNVAPEHVRVIHRNISTNQIWILVSTTSVSDCKSFGTTDYVNLGTVVNNQRSNATAAATIDVTNIYRLVTNAGSATTITNLTGLVDGQELWVLNATTNQRTSQHNATGTGGIMLKGGTNLILNQFEAISLISVGTSWYQK